ncbi:MAG: ComEC/Rec2 family competence protein [Candidatus Omnitrophota bacterium]
MEIASTKKQIYIPFLSLASLSFILGIILANYIKIQFLILFAVASLILIATIYLKRSFLFNTLIISLFLLIGMLHQVNFISPHLDDVYYCTRLESNKVSIEGIVISQVQEGPFDKTFVFSAKSFKTGRFSSKVSGKVFVRFNKRVEIDYGDRLIIEGKLSQIKHKGYFNKRLIRQGIRSVLYVRRGDWISPEAKGSLSIKNFAFKIKEVLKERFSDIVSPPKDFLIAFILGDRSGLSEELYSVFKYTGTVHILAISGLHIGIIIFILLVFLKAIGLKLRIRFIITILFLLFYSFMTGLRPSVVRATIMGITFLLSYIVKREYHIYNSLALAAIIILAIWPWQIFDIGFQLSFISVISIVFISPKILNLLPKIKNRFIRMMEISFVISLSAWLGATPLVAYYFGIVSLISVCANLFIVLLIPFIIAGGFIYLFMHFLIPIFAKWLALSLEFLIYILINLAIFFKSIAFSYFFIDKFPIYILFLYYGLLILCFNRHIIQFLSKRFLK